MRKTKADETSGVLGPVLMDQFQALSEMGVQLTMAQMMALMQRAEATVARVTSNEREAANGHAVGR